MAGITPFRKRDFEVSVEVDQLGPAEADEFAAAIHRAKPSRLDNDIEIVVGHQADQHIHETVQMICNNGIRALTLRTVYPEPWPIRVDPLAYMMFEYQDGRVVDQWTEMSRRDADEPMVDVLKISFTKKTIRDCVWQVENSDG